MNNLPDKPNPETNVVPEPHKAKPDGVYGDTMPTPVAPIGKGEEFPVTGAPTPEIAEPDDEVDDDPEYANDKDVVAEPVASEDKDVPADEDDQEDLAPDNPAAPA